jgi:Tfp pilus assembly protein PilO
VARADSQLHGLQILLAAKHGVCNSGLEVDVRSAAQQLKQTQSTSAAVVEALKEQLVSAEENVQVLQQQLRNAAQNKEHQPLGEVQAMQVGQGELHAALTSSSMSF